MFSNWMFTALNIIAFLYFILMTFYYRNINHQEKNQTSILKITLEEAELLIKKYQVQLQKVLGNSDSLQSELDGVKNDLKNIKSRYAKLKADDTQNKSSIVKLKSKIESLM